MYRKRFLYPEIILGAIFIFFLEIRFLRINFLDRHVNYMKMLIPRSLGPPLGF